MLSKRYLASTRNLDAFLKQLRDGLAPPKFTVEHLKSIGYTSSNDRGLIPLLKDLGFLTPDGEPTPRYHSFRDPSRSKAVMAEALREAYEDVFHISENPKLTDRPAIEGLFRSKHNSTERVAQLQAMTFFALLKNADLSAPPATSLKHQVAITDPSEVTHAEAPSPPAPVPIGAELHYTIQVHLPATKDLEVYNAIFRSLRENLLS